MSKEKDKKKASEKKKPQHTLKEKRQLKKEKSLTNNAVHCIVSICAARWPQALSLLALVNLKSVALSVRAE